MHCSQGFHDSEIANPNDADAWIVQVDSHPQSDRKNGSVNGVEHRKSAANTTIAKAPSNRATVFGDTWRRGRGVPYSIQEPSGRQNIASQQSEPLLIPSSLESIQHAPYHRRYPFSLAGGSQNAAPIQFVGDASQRSCAILLNALDGGRKVGRKSARTRCTELISTVAKGQHPTISHL
jgi:hypothetical protein